MSKSQQGHVDSSYTCLKPHLLMMLFVEGPLATITWVSYSSGKANGPISHVTWSGLNGGLSKDMSKYVQVDFYLKGVLGYVIK